MDSTHYFDLLKSNDHSLARTPEGFDVLKAKREVVEVQTALEPLLGFKSLLDNQIQDATFFEELNLWPQINSKGCASIRFSKYGRLVTIISPHKLTAEKLASVLQELNKREYIYIPCSILESPYDGNEIGIETWMTRYFHWL